MTAVLTPLDPDTRQRLVNRTTGRSEVSYVLSADGVWSYLRDEDQPGTPWEVTHLPTGLVQMATSLARARAWTATPTALDLLRLAATDTLRDPGAGATTRAQAERALLILDGHLIARTEAATPESWCRCGGVLTTRAGRAVHIDTCAEEIATPDQGCPDRIVAHQMCDRPTRAACDHDGCRHPNQIEATCPAGHDRCCGTRHRGES